MEHDKIRERLNSLLHELDKLGRFSTGARQKQEFESAKWDEVVGFCYQLLDEAKPEKKKPLPISDRIHGEAFEAGISGRCADCEISNSHDKLIADKKKLVEALECGGSYEKGDFAEGLLFLAKNLDKLNDVSIAVNMLWLSAKAKAIQQVLAEMK